MDKVLSWSLFLAFYSHMIYKLKCTSDFFYFLGFIIRLEIKEAQKRLRNFEFLMIKTLFIENCKHNMVDRRALK